MTTANTMRETVSTTMLFHHPTRADASLPTPHFHPAFSSRENSFNPLSIRERIERIETQRSMQYRAVAADAFSAQRQLLWDLCYRVTGTAGDADLVLRDCYARAVERPLVDRDADWRPHLIYSAATLAMDVLRRRKRRQYVGAWLPSPIETGNAASRDPRPHTTTGLHDLAFKVCKPAAARRIGRFVQSWLLTRNRMCLPEYFFQSNAA